jgi:hypothetical protein
MLLTLFFPKTEVARKKAILTKMYARMRASAYVRCVDRNEKRKWELCPGPLRCLFLGRDRPRFYRRDATSDCAPFPTLVLVLPSRF